MVMWIATLPNNLIKSLISFATAKLDFAMMCPNSAVTLGKDLNPAQLVRMFTERFQNLIA